MAPPTSFKPTVKEMLNERLKMSGVDQSHERSGDASDCRNASAGAAHHPPWEIRSELRTARLNYTAVSAPDAIGAAKNERAPESVQLVAYSLVLMLLIYRLKTLHVHQDGATAQK